MKKLSVLAVLVLAACVNDPQMGSTVGGAVGGGTGAAVGYGWGGQQGAIIGGAIGGAAGAAVGGNGSRVQQSGGMGGAMNDGRVQRPEGGYDDERRYRDRGDGEGRDYYRRDRGGYRERGDRGEDEGRD